MLNINPSDIVEDELQKIYPGVLKELLLDRASHKNIIWATFEYEKFGRDYSFPNLITPTSITGKQGNIIRPRILKILKDKDLRTRERAEVFTPTWLCNEQINGVDNIWFNREDVFNFETDFGWEVNLSKIDFTKDLKKTWIDYVASKRIEPSCGEGPYLCSRYDPNSGQAIPVQRRIGVLDRKLRVVGENTKNKKDWIRAAEWALKSTYGFDWQGDNVFLTRENILITTLEAYCFKYKSLPEPNFIFEFAKIISWNIWQMDGLKFVVPESCKNTLVEQFTLFSSEKNTILCRGCESGNHYQHNGIYSKIMDWNTLKSLKFVSIVKGSNE